MQKREILGEVIYECNADEARQVWKDEPENRHRIWTTDEVNAHILSDPETLAAVMEQKRKKPGSCLPRGFKGEAPIMPDCSPAWCAAEGCLCSEVVVCGGVMAGTCR